MLHLAKEIEREEGDDKLTCLGNFCQSSEAFGKHRGERKRALCLVLFRRERETQACGLLMDFGVNIEVRL